MKAQIDRKTFLQATVATTLTGIVGCAGSDDTTGGDGDGDGDGTTGGTDGGMTTGGTGTGGGTDAGTGGADPGTGGADSSTGGADTGTGGGDPATGGTNMGTGGGPGGEMCTNDLVITGSGAAEGHSHTLTITMAQLMAGMDLVDMETSEDSGHSHTVTITAAQLMQIRNGETVTVDACSQFLSHRFVINCDAVPPTPGDPDTCA